MATDPAENRAVSAAELLGREGPFAAALDGFQVRREQQEMADAIASVVTARDVLVCEAGTGTGKTLAYLVPALSSGCKTILSTATKTLQDQLFHRDLPLVRDALGLRPDIALLKGRQNYLCLHRLDRTANDPATDYRRAPLLGHLQRWASDSDSGDLEEVSLLNDDPQLRFSVTSTVENCLGQDCPVYERCFVVKARRRAASADVVVVNHHLLFADMVLRDSGFGELLPHAEVVVLDEAHKLPDIASMFFSQSISAQQISSLGRDALDAAALDAADMPDLVALLRTMVDAQGRLGEMLRRFGKRPDWNDLRGHRDIAARVEGLGRDLVLASAALEVAAERSADLDNCYQRAQLLVQKWQLFSDVAANEHVQWIDVGAKNVTFYDTPISVAEEFSQRIESSQAAWILTSATLAIEGRFEHFTAALGISEARERLWASPFDFARNSLLYVPPLRAQPRDPNFERELVDAVLPVLKSSRGRAFFLFTSYRSLGLVADMLRTDNQFQLFIQGDAPRSDLLRRFASADNAVLLGTASFWEGIDVRGEQLSCVIIDKLPFGVPDDPVTKARAAALTEQGGNPFVEMQLPQAITALKQGAGRLIRDTTDRGVLVIGDNRIVRRGYGRAFINSLPPMPLSIDIHEVEQFFAE
jgi:ATP-dependent DNA helicase DinG